MEKHMNFDEIFDKIASKFTPEYFEEASKNAYKDDREYPENFSNWYFCIKDFGNFAHTEIISNQIFTYEDVKLMQKTDDITKVDWNEINNILKPTLDKMDPYTIYNIKNGCFSNKFEFNTCLARRDNLARQLWKINEQSCMFSTGGYTELVVRELIPIDIDHQLTIYNGMPLRTEVRVFYNMDTKQIEYIVDYWDYEYCHENLHSANDRLIFDIFHNKIPKDFDINCHQTELNKVTNNIRSNINTLKFDDKLKGIWSIDFLYDNWLNKIYLIDMARGERSAYWNINKLTQETRERLEVNE